MRGRLVKRTIFARYYAVPNTRVAALDEPERLPCAKARLSERPQVFDPAERRTLRRWKAMKGYRTVLGMAHGTTRDDRRLPERDRSGGRTGGARFLSRERLHGCRLLA